MKYTYRTICRNKGLSLVEKLYEMMGDKYKDYISFYSLRNHATIGNIPKTELIYIHAKFMIVDDEAVIVGSANLNDRSLLGHRDSEVAVLIKGGIKIESTLNGKVALVSEFAKILRVTLIKQHLGLNDDNLDILTDPLSNNFYYFMNERAKLNTFYYKEIFNCYPDNSFEDFKDFKSIKLSTSDELDSNIILKDQYEKNKDKIVGHIVEFPLNFLKNATLDRKLFVKERLISIKVFL